jgi:hypothetical protein
VQSLEQSVEEMRSMIRVLLERTDKGVAPVTEESPTPAPDYTAPTQIDVPAPAPEPVAVVAAPDPEPAPAGEPDEAPAENAPPPPPVGSGPEYVPVNAPATPTPNAVDLVNESQSGGGEEATVHCGNCNGTNLRAIVGVDNKFFYHCDGCGHDQQIEGTPDQAYPVQEG